MNDQLRKAINVKAAMKRKYLKISSQNNWEKYRKQRNLVNKLKKIIFAKILSRKMS